MADDLLTIEGLSKRYELGVRGGEGDAGVSGFFDAAFRTKPEQKAARHLWALKDLTLTVPRGQTLGVIGRNGAGKTTLLKILSRITAPTEGRVVGHGRIFPMLEVGAAFHPNFTGRENVLLNAAMFGVPREEALRRLDNIAEFAGVGDRIDAPVAEMSRSTYVRLAFSAAINMKPDMLLADEVLAVGDPEFRALCLRRIAEEKARGMTVIFVSHDMRAVAETCDAVAWLESGRLRQHGDTREIIVAYESELLASRGHQVGDSSDARRPARLLAARLVHETGEETAAITQREHLIAEITFEAGDGAVAASPGLDIYSGRVHLLRAWSDTAIPLAHPGRYVATFSLPAHTFSARPHVAKFRLLITPKQGRPFALVSPQEISFTVHGGSDHDPDGKQWKRDSRGLLAPKLAWRRSRGAPFEDPRTLDEATW